MYLFNDKLDIPYKYIHPLNEKYVRRLLNKTFPGYVRYIILFGSSLDLTCSVLSDVDLLFIVDEYTDDCVDELHKLCRIMETRFEIIIMELSDFREDAQVFGTLSNCILKEGGLLLHEREKSHSIGQSKG